ncbi:MAG: DNA polymerase II [Thermoplasmata archaeon]|nr:DNA polymerase II [Thermoplasmata archaeon]
MPEIELFLLGGSYRGLPDPGSVLVELYGKDRAGTPVVVLVEKFRPYFQLLEPSAEVRARLRQEPEVVETQETERWVEGRMRPVLTVTVKFPWKVPDFRERYRRPGDELSVLACDIPFVHRYLYDRHLGLTVRCQVEDAPPEVRALYSVDRVVRLVDDGTAAPISAAEPFRPPLTYLSFDIENAIRDRTIFTICGVAATFEDGDESVGTNRRSFQLQGSEAEILTQFVQKVQEFDPDIITGYNIGGYDIPLLLERAKAVGVGELKLGRDRAAPREMGERLWRIPGRVVADAWWSARRELHPKQESLDFVARQLLNDGKLDVDRRNIEGEWAKDPIAVMRYCEHDADLALRILRKLRSIEKATDLATVAHLPLEEGLNGRTSLFVDSLLIPRADERKIGVLPTHRTRSDSAIEGGYVHAIRPGLYAWVVTLDFKSMYPSIIIAKNLCFTTLTTDASAEGTTLAPDGVARFLPAEKMRGIIPEILEGLMRNRAEFRQRSRDAATPALRQYYNGLQEAVKVLMNSFYGVLASSFYRFTNKDIGAAITAFAREAITSIIRALEQDGYDVVYSDTDSVFVRAPTPDKESAIAFGNSIAKRFSVAGASFEFQTVYESFFSHGAKKRYVGRTVWPKEELIIRGYESRRTDAFDFQVDSLNEIFELVLSGATERAVVRAQEMVKEVLEGKVTTAKLVVARSVRAEGEYNESTRDALPFLRAYKQLHQEGYDVIPGMKVAWIVTDAKKTPQDIEPWMAGRPFQGIPDYQYYADRVAQTLARVTEVFDWDAASLLRGKRGPKQQRLGESSDEGTPETEAPTSKAPPISLDTSIGEVSRSPAGRRGTQKRLEFA